MKTNYSELIIKDFNKRKEKNKSYSLRAYAKYLNISPSLLSQIINGKKELTPATFKVIYQKLGISDLEFKKLTYELDYLQKKRNVKNTSVKNITYFDHDSFQVISDWYYFAILQLIETHKFKNDPKWISDRLGLKEDVAKAAIEKLFHVNLIDYDKDKKLIVTFENAAIKDYPYSTEAMKLRQIQILEKAKESILNIGIENRDNSSITIAMDSSLIPSVKERIKKFRRFLGNYIVKNSKTNDCVYEIQINLIPMTITDLEK